jgi:hypothetical protein
MDVSMFRGMHASAVSRSRHSKPPVQLTVQFNRGIGRNPDWRAGADGQTADAPVPEDGQTEAGVRNFLHWWQTPWPRCTPTGLH